MGRPLPVLLALSLTLLVLTCLPNLPAGYAEWSRATNAECEGDACSVVNMSWDEDRQQFRVQNDSNQQVKVDVSTFAGVSSISIAPHKTEYLEVKTFNGSYHANYQ